MNINKNKVPQNPIFIVGFPRSGTTLLQSMIITQKDFFSFPETHFFASVQKQIELNKNGAVVPGCLEKVLNCYYKFTEHRLPKKSLQHLVNDAKKGTLIKKEIFEEITYDLLSAQGYKKEDMANIRWVEKTPAHIFMIEEIHDLYPNAKFIEIIRNPMNSIYSTLFKFNHDSNVSAKSLAYRWIEGHEIFESFMYKHPKNAIRIKYEDLIKNEKEVLYEISKFLSFKLHLSRLKTFSSKAKIIVAKHEKWKSENIENSSLSVKKDYSWNVNDRLMLQFILNKYLLKFEYVDKISASQNVFNFFVRFTLTLYRYKNFIPFKNFFKNNIKKLNFWPLR